MLNHVFRPYWQVLPKPIWIFVVVVVVVVLAKTLFTYFWFSFF